MCNRPDRKTVAAQILSKTVAAQILSKTVAAQILSKTVAAQILSKTVAAQILSKTVAAQILSRLPTTMTGASVGRGAHLGVGVLDSGDRVEVVQA